MPQFICTECTQCGWETDFMVTPGEVAVDCRGCGQEIKVEFIEQEGNYLVVHCSGADISGGYDDGREEEEVVNG